MPLLSPLAIEQTTQRNENKAAAREQRAVPDAGRPQALRDGAGGGRGDLRAVLVHRAHRSALPRNADHAPGEPAIELLID